MSYKNRDYNRNYISFLLAKELELQHWSTISLVHLVSELKHSNLVSNEPIRVKVPAWKDDKTDILSVSPLSR